MSIFINMLQEGLLYGIMAMGVFITYKILDFPDLSVDGTFPLGAVVSGVLIMGGVPPVLALVGSLIAGALAGCVTGLLHVKLGISDLLCGIIVMTGLWSVNLALAGQSAILSFFHMPTVFSIASGGNTKLQTLLVLAIAALLVKFGLDFFFRTRSGLLLRSTGDNSKFVTGLGRDPGKMKILGLALGNGLTALAGGLLAQKDGMANATGGIGMVSMALAAVIIGTSLFGRLRFLKPTTTVLLGMIAYRAVLALALQLEWFHANYLRLMMAVIFTLALVVSRRSQTQKKEGFTNASKV